MNLSLDILYTPLDHLAQSGACGVTSRLSVEALARRLAQFGRELDKTRLLLLSWEAAALLGVLARTETPTRHTLAVSVLSWICL